MSSASTGGTEGSSPASSPASAASLAMAAAPKYGTLVPNRIFVGGISASTSEAELAQLFSAYGNVKATKIISDRAGVSKGYGFVTFETEEEAKRLQQESECIVLRERKLNIAPAIKKQPFNRSFDGGSGSPPAVPTSTYYYTNGMSLTYQNGMTFYNAGAPVPGTAVAPPPTDPAALYQATGVFGPQATTSHQTFAPVMYPCPAPSLYMPQQYQYSPMPYEPYYTGATAAGTQYMFATSNSQNTTSGSGNGSGTNSNGTGATSPSAGPPSLPSLPPPPPTHFYAPAVPHHHAPVPAGPPAPQMDHLYYSFAGHPPPPPHTQIGLGDQQLLLYTTDASCQQQTSESQGNQQEDSHSTSSHTEQQQIETQAAQPSGSSTPLVSLMPVKFPMTGRYTNYHPLTLHAANLHSSQNCLNETDDCNSNQMHCRTYVYHPAVYIPHSHPPSYHTTSGTTSLLPTPPPPPPPHPPPSTQQTFDYNQKQNFRDYSKSKVMNPQSNYTSNSNYLMSGIHQNSFSKSQGSGNPQIFKYGVEAMHKYQSLNIPTSRLSGHHYKRNFGPNAGSSSCFLSQKSGAYNSAQNTHKSAGQTYSSACLNKSNIEYTNGRRNYNEYHADNPNTKSLYTSGRKNASYRANSMTDFDGLKNGQTSDSNFGSNRVISQSNTNLQSNSNLQNIVNSQSGNSTETGNTDKPTSPPPAPYSPMTRPLPTLSPPTSQVQFYTPAQNRFQQPPPMPHQQQSNQRRYAAPPPLRRTSDKYSNATSQNSVIRQPNKYKVNGIIQTGNKVSEDSIGGAGDAPPAVGRIPLTPPGTPRNHSSEQNQLSDACHQMQALNI